MNRNPFRIVLPVLLLLLLVTTAESQSVDVDEAIREVVVRNPTAQRFIRRGTAFHVSGGVFYTNAHVVKSPVPEGFTDWYLASKTSTRYVNTWLGPFTVTCVHPRWRDPGDPNRSHPYDVARLKIEDAAAVPSLAFHDRPPVAGQRVTIKGFPAASRGWPPILYTATGRISEVRWQNHTFLIEIETGFALGGSSGSPLLTEDGRVVGIYYAGFGGRDRTARTTTLAVFASAAMEGCPF